MTFDKKGDRATIGTLSETAQIPIQDSALDRRHAESDRAMSYFQPQSLIDPAQNGWNLERAQFLLRSVNKRRSYCTIF